MRIKPLLTCLLLFVFFALPIVGQKTQPRPKYLNEKATIVPVGNIEVGKKYPLIIFLPYTTGSGEDFFDRVKDVQVEQAYFALIPQGTAQRDDYLPDFMAYIGWYEERLLKDIERAKKDYAVDVSKIYLEGFSLGGDLSWAFMIRHKDIFKGAIMFGTRCSYPATKKDLADLVKLDRRFVFAAGDSDDKARVDGLKAAYSLIQKAKIPSSLTLLKNQGHSFSLDHDFWQAAWELME